MKRVRRKRAPAASVATAAVVADSVVVATVAVVVAAVVVVRNPAGKRDAWLTPGAGTQNDGSVPLVSSGLDRTAHRRVLAQGPRRFSFAHAYPATKQSGPRAVYRQTCQRHRLVPTTNRSMRLPAPPPRRASSAQRRPRAVVVRRFAPAMTSHVGADDVHLVGTGRADLRAEDLFARTVHGRLPIERPQRFVRLLLRAVLLGLSARAYPRRVRRRCDPMHSRARRGNMPATFGTSSPDASGHAS